MVDIVAFLPLVVVRLSFVSVRRRSVVFEFSMCNCNCFVRGLAFGDFGFGFKFVASGLRVKTCRFKCEYYRQLETRVIYTLLKTRV